MPVAIVAGYHLPSRPTLTDTSVSAAVFRLMLRRCAWFFVSEGRLQELRLMGDIEQMPTRTPEAASAF